MKNFINEKHGPSEEGSLIGAHISISKGLDQAVYDAFSIGATTMQIFTAPHRQWHAKPFVETQISSYVEAIKKTNIRSVMSHASYLINLGSPREDVRLKSIDSFKTEIERCFDLGIAYLNFHPGSSLDSPVEPCLNAVIEAILSMKEYFSSNTSLRILFENSAGQGSCIGATFEELSYLVENVKNEIPVGVCLDTCHLFAAGYDLRSKEAINDTLHRFDEVVGLQHLKAMHLNDSEGGFGTRKDRHSLLGEGCIGKEAFGLIMKDPRLYAIPKYLETPGDLSIWADEIAWLKSQIPTTLRSL
jgi:deoxyribonuclease IV